MLWREPAASTGAEGLGWECGVRGGGVNCIKGKDKHITASPVAASGIMNSLITAEGVIHL